MGLRINIDKTEAQMISKRKMDLNIVMPRRTAGVTRLDRVRNEDIRNNLKIRRDIEKVELRRISYFGYVARMDHNASQTFPSMVV